MDTRIALVDDERLYQEESEKARRASAAFDRNVLRPSYDAVFRSLLA